MPLSLGWGVWPNGTLRLAVCCPSPGIPGALGKGLSCLTFHHICSVCDIRCLARPSTLVVHVPHWRPTRDGVVSTGVWGSHFQSAGIAHNDRLLVLLESCGETREAEVQQLPPHCGIIRLAAGILVAVMEVYVGVCVRDKESWNVGFGTLIENVE